jgi:eukaryotic-like serine/threonine-protein kinase
MWLIKSNMIKFINTIAIIFFAVSLTAQSTISWPIFRGNQQLTGVSKTELPDQPKLLWTFQTGDNIKSAPVVDQGKVVIGSTDGVVYCLDTTGKLLWKYETSNAIEAPALIHKNTVYIGNLDGNFYALDLNTGAKKWEYETDNQIIGSANWWEAWGHHLYSGWQLRLLPALRGCANRRGEMEIRIR